MLRATPGLTWEPRVMWPGACVPVPAPQHFPPGISSTEVTPSERAKTPCREGIRQHAVCTCPSLGRQATCPQEPTGHSLVLEDGREQGLGAE